jgi:hypothetical protein
MAADATTGVGPRTIRASGTTTAGGLPVLAGKVFLGKDGVGGQGVLPSPIAYEGWVERAVAAYAPFTAALTSCQRQPILYRTRPEVCRPGNRTDRPEVESEPALRIPGRSPPAGLTCWLWSGRAGRCATRSR